eukprot:NODE_597_length_5571_cov_0.535270.p2 type:complete len:407 gc:universal NODE_597_length_5571_cov_0.535270:3741-2521(-)
MQNESNWQIMLRQPQTTVLYHEKDNKIQLLKSNFQNCPLCGSHLDNNNPVYMDNDYFKCLSNLINENLPSYLFNDGYYERFFIQQDQLGRGGRGSVFKCLHILDSISLGYFAVKKVPTGESHEYLKKLLREVTLLQQLRHDHIVKYMHVWLEHAQMTQFGPNIPVLFILMEYINGNNLQNWMHPDFQIKHCMSKQESNKKSGIGISIDDQIMRCLDSTTILKLFLDLLSGLSYLHSLDILHRDLKPNNLLLRFNDSVNQLDVPTILLSDFGESISLNQGLSKDPRDHSTMDFMSPELLKTHLFTKESDIWSSGICLYFICFGKLPYSSEDVDILEHEIGRIQFNYQVECTRVDNSLKQAIQKMVHLDPNQRPSAEHLLKHGKLIYEEMKIRDQQQRVDIGHTLAWK